MITLKKIFIVLSLFVFIACNSRQQNEINKPDFFTCNLKVIGLNDSLILDTLWKINFLPGIESVYISKNDSIMSVKADRTIINLPELMEVIENRGATIIDNY